MQTNDPAYLFERYGRLARVVSDERGLPVVAEVPRDTLRGLFMRAAHWREEVELPNHEVKLRPILPPGYIATDFAAHADWPVRALFGLSPIPVLRLDGTLHTEPGYDTRSGWWYQPSPDLAAFQAPVHLNAEAVRPAVAVNGQRRSWLAVARNSSICSFTRCVANARARAPARPPTARP